MQSGPQSGTQFVDTSTQADADPRTPMSAPRQPRRPVNAGWVVMIGAGLIAAVANFAVLTSRGGGVDVAVLAEGVPAGTPVGQLQVQVQQVDLEDPEGYLLAQPAQLDPDGGMVTTTSLEAGVMLRSTDLWIPDDGDLGTISVPISASRAAGGLLVAGDTVDVISEVTGPGEGGDTVGYVVRGLSVIDAVQPDGGLTSSGMYTVILAVDDEQALQVARALRADQMDLVRTARTGGP